MVMQGRGTDWSRGEQEMNRKPLDWNRIDEPWQSVGLKGEGNAACLKATAMKRLALDMG